MAEKTNPVSWAFGKLKMWNDALWHTPLSELSRRKSFLFKQIRILVLAARNSLTDRVNLRASALTFYTLLSIIPVIAIAFSIAKGFGLDQNLETIIKNSKEFNSYPDFLTRLLDVGRSTMEHTNGGYIAGVGVIILFWSVVSLLNQIENSFNHIWQITSPRAWYRKFTDYLTIMLIAPFFIVLFSSLTVFIKTQLSDFMANAPILSSFKWLVAFLIKFAPWLLTWIMLTLLFIVMPNVKVKFVPALVSGIIAGTILQMLQWLYFDLQIGITKLSAIYGGLAFVPLFIILIQMSWMTILLGAELSFANQNVSRYEFESEALSISNFQKRAMVLMIMHMIVRNFAVGEKPVSAETIGRSLRIPVRLAQEILNELTRTSLISIVHENDQKEQLYQPALDINKLSISYILSKLDRCGTDLKVAMKNREYETITAMLDRFERLMTKSDHNILIKDI